MPGAGGASRAAGHLSGVPHITVADLAGPDSQWDPQPVTGQPREQMLMRIGELKGRIRAWRQRRRGRQAADPLLWLDCERAPARATLAYYNQVGDPSL
jgi:hypothetical protein